MGTLAIFWAALVHMGTGAIFGLIATRPLFYSPVRPFEFLAAAMASGLALLIIAVVAVFKFSNRKLDPGIIFSLSRLLLALIIILFTMVFIDKLTHLYSPDREATIWLLTGPYAWVFWGLQICCGYLLPILLLAYPGYGKTMRGVMTASFLVVAGIFGERFALVIPGPAYPMPFYPGKIEGMWGAAGSFPVTPIETLLCVGVFALMGLIFIMGLKNLELLPANDEAGEKAPAKV